MFETLRQAVIDEFSDLSTGEITRVVLRLLVAALLGGLLGYEREKSGKPAGFRTHMLVAMGTAFFVLVPQTAGFTSESLGRIIQGIAAGIGFLGAGSIIKHSDERVEGLTTAAGIWMTAAVGVAVGLGREGSAIVGTILALIVLNAQIFASTLGVSSSRKKLLDP